MSVNDLHIPELLCFSAKSFTEFNKEIMGLGLPITYSLQAVLACFCLSQITFHLLVILHCLRSKKVFLQYFSYNFQLVL